MPDNLKSLFRPCAMVAPDAAMIARVILVTQGFAHAAYRARGLGLTAAVKGDSPREQGSICHIRAQEGRLEAA